MAEESSANLDERLSEHREVWRQKEVLRVIYGDYYRRMLASCPHQGRILDIGGGSAHAKEFRENIVTLDILPFPGIDVVADAHELPFADGSFSGIIMLDVLHHLDRPVTFLKEAARVLAPGGVLAMIEPGITPVSWWFYNFLHQEPVILGQDPYTMTVPQTGKDPFDSNQAIPTLLFGSQKRSAKLASVVPEFEEAHVEWLSLFAYPLSGGFKRWCLVPKGAVAPLIRFEDQVPRTLRRLLGFRLSATLQRKP